VLQISRNSVLGMTPAVPTRIQTCSAPFSLHIQPLILKSTDLLSAINSLILAHASSLSTALIPADLFAIFDITDNFDSSFDMFCVISYVCSLSRQHHMFGFDWTPKQLSTHGHTWWFQFFQAFWDLFMAESLLGAFYSVQLLSQWACLDNCCISNAMLYLICHKQLVCSSL